ncbi:MAG: hypothetical protein AAB325_06115 [Pseudomonadota bacterium]
MSELLAGNHKRFGVNVRAPSLLSHIEREFNGSLNVLRTVKNQLQKTDWLIDQIVYRLYGITKDEIAIIEDALSGSEEC